MCLQLTSLAKLLAHPIGSWQADYTASEIANER